MSADHIARLLIDPGGDCLAPVNGRCADTEMAGFELEGFLVVGERGRAAVDDPDEILMVDRDADGGARTQWLGRNRGQSGATGPTISV